MTRKMTRAPVFFAIVQARFNPILALDSYAPQIQDQLRRHGFPDAEKGHLATMNLNLTSLPGNGAPQVPVSQTTRYTFRNMERTAGFVLDQGALSFQTTEYDVFPDFSTQFLDGLQAVHDAVDLNYTDRIGFRYLDAVFPTPGESLADYLKTSVLGLTDTLQADLIHSLTETRYRTLNIGVLGRVRILDGNVEFPPDLVPNILSISQRFQDLTGRHAILDTDGSIQHRATFDLERIGNDLAAIHEEIAKVFDSTITSHACDYWRKTMNHTTHAQAVPAPDSPDTHSDIGAHLSSELPVGTGGNTTIECLSARGRREYSFPVVDPADFSLPPIDVVTTADHLEFIRTNLSLSVADIARALRVSRQSIYAWFSGGSVSTENSARIEDLVQAANIIVGAGVQVTRQVLQRPISSGQNLVEIVATGGSASVAAEALVEILHDEAQQRKRLHARHAMRPPLRPENYVDLGAPKLDEEN